MKGSKSNKFANVTNGPNSEQTSAALTTMQTK